MRCVREGCDDNFVTFSVQFDDTERDTNDDVVKDGKRRLTYICVKCMIVGRLCVKFCFVCCTSWQPHTR